MELHDTDPYPGTTGLIYTERGMTTGTHCTGMKELGTHTNPVTQKHTGKLDVHRQEAVCLMPVFFRPGCRAEEVEGGGEGKMRMGGMRGREKNKRRMKADAEKHQLKTTAAGEPDRARRERRETMLEERKDRKNPQWRNGGVGEKNKRRNIEAGRQGETGRQGRGRKRRRYIHAPRSLVSRHAGRKTRGEGENNAMMIE